MSKRFSISVFTIFLIRFTFTKDHILFDEQTPDEIHLTNYLDLVHGSMDFSINPCNDFYKYACGNYGNVDEFYNNGLDALNHLYLKVRKTIDQLYINEIRRKSVVDPCYGDLSKVDNVRIYYKSCISNNKIETLGTQPALDFLNEFNGWPIDETPSIRESFDWLNLTAQIRLYGQKYLFSQDLTVNVVGVRRTFLIKGAFIHTEGDNNSSTVDNLYNTLLVKFGPDFMSKRFIRRMINFDNMLNSFSRKNIEILNRLTLQQLSDEIPQINWQRYLSIVQNRTVDMSEEILTYHLGYFKELGEFLSTKPSRSIGNYLLFRFVLFVKELLVPNTERKCYEYIKTQFRNTLNEMFADKYFTETSKITGVAVAKNIQNAIIEFIGRIRWLDATTKRFTQEKIESIDVVIGIPDDLYDRDRNFPLMKIDEYFDNSIKLYHYNNRPNSSLEFDNVHKLNLYEVNALYYGFKFSGTYGTIFTPAAIMQPPYFHRSLPNWANYGGYGFVLGHEFTHSFNTDDIKYKKDEKFEWWTKESFKQYIMRTLCYALQYDQFKFEEIDENIHGQQTLNDNMSDNGGLKFAFDAYNKWLRNSEESEENQIHNRFNLTGKQLFFVSFAQKFCGTESLNTKHFQIQSYGHSPNRFRVIGSVSNSWEFARSFQCPIGSNMNPHRKCHF